jgi:hypothetical protein
MPSLRDSALAGSRNLKGITNALSDLIVRLRSMGFVFETLSPDNPPKSELASVQLRPS